MFNEAERTFNTQLTAKLVERGFSVYLPQRDGFELDDPKSQRMSDEERQDAIFAMDRDKVLEADIFLFILDGRVPDDGACVELGITYTQKYLTGRPKFLIGLKTDWRIFFSWAKLNAMLWGALDSLVDNEEQLIEELERLRAACWLKTGHSRLVLDFALGAGSILSLVLARTRFIDKQAAILLNSRDVLRSTKPAALR